MCVKWGVLCSCLSFEIMSLIQWWQFSYLRHFWIQSKQDLWRDHFNLHLLIAKTWRLDVYICSYLFTDMNKFYGVPPRAFPVRGQVKQSVESYSLSIFVAHLLNTQQTHTQSGKSPILLKEGWIVQQRSSHIVNYNRVRCAIKSSK